MAPSKHLSDLLFQLSAYGKALKQIADRAETVRKGGYATDNVPDKPAIWRMTELANVINEICRDRDERLRNHQPADERARD